MNELNSEPNSIKLRLNMSHNKLNFDNNVVKESLIKSANYLHKSLDLSYNQIHDLPLDFVNAFTRNNFDNLNLKSNQIQSIEWMNANCAAIFGGNNGLPIPKWIETIDTIQNITINNCNLKTFDPSQFGYGMKSLIHLDLSSNNIDSIGSFLNNGSTEGLISLIVSRNSIVDLSESNLHYLKLLEVLMVDRNQINSVKFLDGINMPYLKVMDFSYNNINEIPITISFMPSIIDINLSHNEIQLIGGQFLKSFKHLEIFKCSYNKLGSHPIFSDGIASNIFKNNDKLKLIQLSNNELSTSISNEMFTNLENLQEIDFSFNKITIIESQSFNMNTNIEIINLENNAINVLPSLLFSNNKKLRILKLNNNNIESIPMVPYGTFRNNVVLEIITLSNNLINEIPNNVSRILYMNR